MGGQQLRHFRAAAGVPGSQQQSGLGALPLECPEGIQNGRLLVAAGAAGDHQERRGGELHQGAKLSQPGLKPAWRFDVVFQVAAHLHPVRRGSQGDNPFPVHRVLHAAAVEQAHRPPQPTAEAVVLSEGAVGDTSVGQADRDPPLAAFMKEIGPDLRFQDQDQPGPHPVEAAPHGELPVQGKIENARQPLPVLAGQFLTGP